MSIRNYRAGEWVEVLSPREIAKTLDANGTLDGLPFMPEMMALCGQRFQIARLASKTCIEYSGVFYKIREFLHDDVVILNSPRCSGASHGGCQRGCTLFWKAAWLRATTPDEPQRNPDLSPPANWPAGLKTQRSAERYMCQSTELDAATASISRWRILQKCVSDVRSGNRGFGEMVRLVVNPVGRKIFGKLLRSYPPGKLTRTPVGKLNLQPGELVQIKSEKEIAQTLDKRGRNRGMVCDTGMTRLSGGTFKVRNRLDKMICEPDGRMRDVEATVILEGSNCLCWNVVGGCPRNDYSYWREVWLERVGPKPLGPRTSASVPIESASCDFPRPKADRTTSELTPQ